MNTLQDTIANRIESHTKMSRQLCEHIAADILRCLNIENVPAAAPTSFDVFLSEWGKEFGSKRVSVSELLPLARVPLELGDSERSAQVKLGMILRNSRTLPIRGRKIKRDGASNGRTCWRLLPL